MNKSSYHSRKNNGCECIRHIHYVCIIILIDIDHIHRNTKYLYYMNVLERHFAFSNPINYTRRFDAIVEKLHVIVIIKFLRAFCTLLNLTYCFYF